MGGDLSAGYHPSEIGGDRDGDAISLIEIQIARSESPRFTLDAVFDADHDSDLRRGSCSREFSSICSEQVFWSLVALLWAISPSGPPPPHPGTDAGLESWNRHRQRR